MKIVWKSNQRTNKNTKIYLGKRIFSIISKRKKKMGGKHKKISLFLLFNLYIALLHRAMFPILPISISSFKMHSLVQISPRNSSNNISFSTQKQSPKLRSINHSCFIKLSTHCQLQQKNQ